MSLTANITPTTHKRVRVNKDRKGHRVQLVKKEILVHRGHPVLQDRPARKETQVHRGQEAPVGARGLTGPTGPAGPVVSGGSVDLSNYLDRTKGGNILKALTFTSSHGADRQISGLSDQPLNGTAACTLVCDIIALKAGQELFQACFTPDKGTSHMDLVPLMRAYSNATTSTLKTQILSLYAY